MSDVPRLLLGSLWLRPYVFAFLTVHLLGTSGLLGWRRTTAFTVITWAVAFVAEASSIRTGIPFGWYYYVPTTAHRELWIFGVPFFDSLSFSFLLAASYGLAWLLLVPGRPGAGSRPSRAAHILVAVCLFVLADVAIDPVALRGDRWFLGRIYGYPEPGIYFGVPLANFLGWAVVGLVAAGLYHAWERRLPATGLIGCRGRALLCPALYFIVLAFNLGVTFAIGEWRLGLTGLALATPVAIWTLAILAGLRFYTWRPRGEGIRA